MINLFPKGGWRGFPPAFDGKMICFRLVTPLGCLLSALEESASEMGSDFDQERLVVMSWIPWADCMPSDPGDQSLISTEAQSLAQFAQPVSPLKLKLKLIHNLRTASSIQFVRIGSICRTGMLFRNFQEPF
jgi:hypothetical protein